MTNPAVTIAMVTYNSSKFVGMAIESILSSSYTDFELLISDDCSSDDTWEIINRYDDPRIVRQRSSVNIGEYANRNLCVEKAKGAYFIFIDGDDVLYPHGLEFIMKMANGFPECGILIMYPFDRRILLPLIIDSRTYYQNYFFGYGLLTVAFTNTLFKTSALLSQKLTNRYKAGDDFVRLRIAATNCTLIIPDQLTWWRETSGQASQKLNNNKLLSISQRIELGLEVLNNPEVPLGGDEILAAKKALLFQLKMEIFQLFKTLNLNVVIKMLKLKNRLSASFLQLIFAKKPNIDPFKAFSPDSPCQKDFFKSPYVYHSGNIEN